MKRVVPIRPQEIGPRGRDSAVAVATAPPPGLLLGQTLAVDMAGRALRPAVSPFETDADLVALSPPSPLGTGDTRPTDRDAMGVATPEGTPPGSVRAPTRVPPRQMTEGDVARGRRTTSETRCDGASC